MIWGEHGRTDVGGMFSHDDYIEFTRRDRLEHANRGYEWFDMIKLEFNMMKFWMKEKCTHGFTHLMKK